MRSCGGVLAKAAHHFLHTFGHAVLVGYQTSWAVGQTIGKTYFFDPHSTFDGIGAEIFVGFLFFFQCSLGIFVFQVGGTLGNVNQLFVVEFTEAPYCMA